MFRRVRLSRVCDLSLRRVRVRLPSLEGVRVPVAGPQTLTGTVTGMATGTRTRRRTRSTFRAFGVFGCEAEIVGFLSLVSRIRPFFRSDRIFVKQLAQQSVTAIRVHPRLLPDGGPNHPVIETLVIGRDS